jgi:hypothetical protein
MCSHVLQNIHELRELKQLFPELPVLFICTSASPQELTESEQHQLQETICLQEESCCMSQCQRREDIDKSLLQLAQQLARIGKVMYFQPRPWFYHFLLPDITVFISGSFMQLLVIQGGM